MDCMYSCMHVVCAAMTLCICKCANACMGARMCVPRSIKYPDVLLPRKCIEELLKHRCHIGKKWAINM